ncbi:MAG: eukaryotic-like serine/threonine-protein kinase [Solirubrobacteraceae bacterium]|nr:eukaryotic-like serine/threonine-protein kinase [Solirubrobacteraceae bacterium]
MPLDDYDVIREIRGGEHAVVRLARERAGGRLVVLRTFDTADPDALERFRREVETIAGLEHPGIAAVLEVFEDDAGTTVVTEWVEGGSLRGVIGELSTEQVAGVVDELLETVAIAADAGVVHLGLKPENVLITTDGHTKVSDFGIASVAWLDTALTRTGASMRDLSYISPEQVRGDVAGPATDLYAIGCMAYEMLTGRPPFRSDSKLELAMAHLERPLPDPLEVDPSIPEPLARWVVRMTEKDPADRFADAGAAQAALERALEQAAQAPPPAADPDALLAGLRKTARAGVRVHHVSGQPSPQAVQSPPDPPLAPAPQPSASVPSPAPQVPPPPPPQPEPLAPAPQQAEPPPPADLPQHADAEPPAPRIPLRRSAPWLRAPIAIARAFRERRGASLATLAALTAAVVAAGRLLSLFTIEIDVERERELDTVDCTVFAPPEARPGEQILVQVFVHLPVQEATARALAGEFDEVATRRAVCRASRPRSSAARGSSSDCAWRAPTSTSPPRRCTGAGARRRSSSA